MQQHDPQIMKPRPKAPHLQIYRWPITMAMSMAHRITGVVVYFGTFLLTIWLVSLAYSPYAYAMVQAVLCSFFGKVIAFFYVFALLHYLVGGLRFLIGEAQPNYLDKEYADKLAWANIIVSAAAAVFVGVIGFFWYC